MFAQNIEYGFGHILDPNGLDHVLFLILIALPFFLSDWKKVLILATAFTIGHSVTLSLAAFSIISFNSQIIEILIALSILIAAVFNIMAVTSHSNLKNRYSSALIFGLIHGMGFSGLFRSLYGKDELLIPLLGFNIGLELAQILVVLLVLILNELVVRRGGLLKNKWILTISIITALWAIKLILERL